MSVLKDDLRPDGITLLAKGYGPRLSAVVDTERLAELELTGLLSMVSDTAMDRVAALAAGLLDAPKGYVTLVSADQQRAVGAFDPQTPDASHTIDLRGSLCQFQVVTAEPLIITDTARDGLTRAMTTVQEHGVRAYLGVPLRTPSGHVLGALCVHDGHPRNWTPQQVQLLSDLAVVVARDIQHRLTEQRQDQANTLSRQFVHDVEQLTDVVTPLVELAEQQDDARLQRYASLARKRLRQTTTAAAELSAVQPSTAPTAAPLTMTPDLARVVQRAVDAALLATGTHSIDLAHPQEPLVVPSDPVRLERSLVHLLVSALHHTTTGEHLRVGLVRVQPGTGPASAELVLSALGTRIPATELGRIVGRFASSMDERHVDGEAPRAAALRIVRGEVHADSGQVSGRSSHCGLTFRARWSL